MSAASIPITINPAINPYSTAVAPFLSRATRRNNFNIALSPVPLCPYKPLRRTTCGVKDILTASEQISDNVILVVAAAMVDGAGRVLVQRRPPGKSFGGLWEFPGGKCEPGETPKDALVRELMEELGINVEVDDLEAVTFASEPLGDKHLLLLLYVCRRWAGVPSLYHATDLGWVLPADLKSLEMPPADYPLISVLEKLF